MATTAQLKQAERRALGPVPPLNSFSRDGWCKVLLAMNATVFGKRTKAAMRAEVLRRVAAGEAFPSRDRLYPHAKQILRGD